ncbi:anti-sigma B factor antagonist [Nonomuraea solani]|uniref:Anti-sigma factor antagonist n=1 Tax=Nonomuraea solani TaxID=1144553 RepID=A0A1H6DDF2_9ACTN|nr:STAS domain-containing protein [Nonomuraea solani]SEG83487.1 anti-sigma B factor antagonist [Nonomuraea solani]
MRSMGVDVLELSRRQHGELVVVSLAGELDADNISQVRKCLDEAVRASEPRLVVDLSAVTFIDTTGLGVLVRQLATVREREGSMALVAPDGQVLRRLRRTNLAPLFPIYDTLPEALSDALA